MFEYCINLTTAPELPATTLVAHCYNYMFNGCTSLTTAPELPARKLKQNCYYRMFYNCKKLNYIICDATDISASGCTYYWLYSVASTGTFATRDLDNDLSFWPSGASGIPSGWSKRYIF